MLKKLKGDIILAGTVGRALRMY